MIMKKKSTYLLIAIVFCTIAGLITGFGFCAKLIVVTAKRQNNATIFFNTGIVVFL